MKTIVKVYLKDEHGNKDWFVTPINLPEAPGLEEAREKLKLDSMTKDELAAYYSHLDNLIILRDNIHTEREEGRAEGLVKGREEEKRENARNLKRLGVLSDIISQATGLSKNEIEEL